MILFDGERYPFSGFSLQPHVVEIPLIDRFGEMPYSKFIEALKTCPDTKRPGEYMRQRRIEEAQRIKVNRISEPTQVIEVIVIRADPRDH